MAVRTWVGRFGIARGQAEEMGPWQGAFTWREPGEEPADLYVLVHPALPGSEEFCGQLVAVIGHLFERQSLSLTGALIKAISAAHENLRDWNRRSLREHQVGAGLSCLVVRGPLAYLAQVGPSLAYYRSGGTLHRLVPQDPQSTTVVGLGEELRPELTRFDLSPGDLVLVTSPGLSDIANDETLDALLATDAEQALSEIYLLTRDLPDFSAFLLSCYVEPDAAVEVTPTTAEEPVAAEVEQWAAPADEEVEPPPAYAAPAPEPPPTPPEEVDSLPPEGEAGEEQPTLFTLKSEAAVAPPPDITHTTVRLRSSQPSLRHYARATTSSRTSLFSWWMLIIALLLGAGALLAWCLLPDSMEKNREDKFSSLLTDARASYSNALTLSDLSQKRSQLEKADSLLVNAADIHPSDSELQNLRLEVSQALAVMDAVYEVTDLRLLADLRTQVTGDISVQRLVVGDGEAYFLDRKGGRVIALSLGQPEAKAEVILSEGDFVGVVKAGRPLQMTWAPDTNGGRLLILDSDRQLFSFHPSKGTGLVSLRGADGWKSADGLASYNGNLYVLDSQGDQVWRYLPTDGGFDSERSGMLSGTDLAGAVGLSVGGDIYVLTDKGNVRRFSGGQEMAFKMDGIDQPIVSPASLLLMEEGLLVVDRGNKRVVALSFNGQFQRQFVSSKFTDPQSVDVDEVAARLYLLDGDSFYDAPLPPLGQENRPAATEEPPAQETPPGDQQETTPLPP
jgi:hypothetical protein